MPAYADLEIGLSRAAERTYSVVLRFNAPDSDDDKRWPDQGEWQITLDFQQLRDLEVYMDEYGKTLFKALLRDEIRDTFAREIQTAAREKAAILRVRLFIDPGAAELHNLHWEALRDPLSGELLFAGERVVLSRYLTSTDWTPIRSRPRSDLNALVVIANGAKLNLYGFAAVDVPGEAAMAKEALGERIHTTFLHETGTRATLDNIVANLRGYDILYLVCHGMLKKVDEDDPRTWEPKILLEKESGDAVPASGVEFVRQVQKLQERPRLVVLASCQSGGNAEARSSQDVRTIAAALGPQLAQAGIPAVIAMRGNISMSTSKTFMRSFFEQLAMDGQIDRAMGVARDAVRNENDFWMPVLYMRLRSGKVWYIPGFEERQGFDQWASICRFVQSGKFVPIIGPEMAEQVFGSARDLSAHLADKNFFPLSAFERNDTAKVAQYVLHRSSVIDLQDSVKEFWADQVAARYPAALDGGAGMLEELAKLQSADESNPYTILAGLNQASVYVTATADTLLARALTAAKRPPVELVPRWRDERKEGAGEPELDGDPSPDRPVLFYAYGKYKGDNSEEETWVLTEDDFFDYMIRASKYHLIPGSIAFSLCTNSLMFLGFPLDDWKFRIFFRMILSLGGSELIRSGAARTDVSGTQADRIKRFNHVAVQVNPDETSLADANRARKYLESYFKTASNIDFYWGTATDFLRQLRDEVKKRPVRKASI